MCHRVNVVCAVERDRESARIFVGVRLCSNVCFLPDCSCQAYLPLLLSLPPSRCRTVPGTKLKTNTDQNFLFICCGTFDPVLTEEQQSMASIMPEEKSEKTLIILHEFPRVKNCPSHSPYPLKVGTFLRMNKLDYTSGNLKLYNNTTS